MPSIDRRVIKLTLEVDDGATITFNQDFQITAYGTKYANQLQNECQVVLENLNRHTQNYLLTALSPYNLDYRPKFIRLEAGRESYGTSVIYEGNIMMCGLTQPPDIGVLLHCLTGNYAKGSMVSTTQGGRVPFDIICQQIAIDLGVLLEFQATNKDIPSYQFGGPALAQLNVINSYGGVNAFIDNGILIVKDGFIPIRGVMTEVNIKTGMVGIPNFTEQGVRTKFLVDKSTRIGGGLRLKSKQYPTVDGDYVIQKLGFEITSREDPFYYVADCVEVRQS